MRNRQIPRPKVNICKLLILYAYVWLCTAVQAQIYVTNDAIGSTIGEYDTNTGATINSSLVSGLNGALGIAVSGTTIYVSNNSNIGEYDANTGATINAAFITAGLSAPFGVAVSGTDLFVTNYGNNTVGKYNVTTGATINAAFISNVPVPTDILISGQNLYLTTGNKVKLYNAVTGAIISNSFITVTSSFNDAFGLAMFGSNLFVSQQNGTIGEYDAITGATINASFITGAGKPVGIAVFGSDLYVPDQNGTTIGEYNATTGAIINASFVTGLNAPTGIVIVSNTIPETDTFSIFAGLSVLCAILLHRTAKRKYPRTSMSNAPTPDWPRTFRCLSSGSRRFRLRIRG